MKFGAVVVTIFAILCAISPQAASAQTRHGKGLTAKQIKKHPTWLKMPEHICNIDFVREIAVTYDEELGWVIVWRCTCKQHPNGITYICWWRPVRILPDNASNGRILRAIKYAQQGRRYTKPHFRKLGLVYRVHYKGKGCYWRNEKNKMVVWSRYLGG